MPGPSARHSALRLFVPLAAVTMVVALAVVLIGLSDRALAILRGHELPKAASPQPVEWVEEPAQPTTEAAAAPEAIAPGAVAASPEPVRAASPPFAVHLAQPIRIARPMDIGPDITPDRKDDRLCLRCRQGANELLTTGDGSALYAFRLAQHAEGRLWFRMRYSSDGIGDVQCNNSLVVSVDGQPEAILGNDNVRTHWAWSPGPAVALSPGVHWVHVAMREDGALLDRMAFFPETRSRRPHGLDDVEVVQFGGLAGERSPIEPQHPIQDVELFALPTGSLVVGAGHLNEITVCASWQGRRGEGFEGTIAIHSATAPGLTAKGQPQIACGPDAPFARSVVELEFPPDTPRRAHKVIVSVADRDGAVVFHTEMRFVKACAWAFLGPFQDDRRGAAARSATGDVVERRWLCERSPLLLARLADAGRLGLGGVPLARGQGQAEWRVIADGSCCDWTGGVDLQKLYGPTEGAFAYAVTWLHARQSLGRRLVSLEADDAAWLWVNGSFLVQLPTELPREANRLWTSGPLRRGPNPVVIKVTQARGYWGFRFEVVDWHWQGRKGSYDVITGLEPEQWPGR